MNVVWWTVIVVVDTVIHLDFFCWLDVNAMRHGRGSRSEEASMRFLWYG